MFNRYVVDVSVANYSITNEEPTKTKIEPSKMGMSRVSASKPPFFVNVSTHHCLGIIIVLGDGNPAAYVPNHSLSRTSWGKIARARISRSNSGDPAPGWAETVETCVVALE